MPKHHGWVLLLLFASLSAVSGHAAAPSEPEPEPNTSAPAASTVFVPVIATAVLAPAASTGLPAAPTGPPTPASMTGPVQAHAMSATAPALPAPPAKPADTAPAAATTAAPAASTAAVAHLDYSYLEATTLQTQPYGHTDIGHGQRFTASFALSTQAFLVAKGARRNLATQNTHTWDLGVGINSERTPGHNFFLEILWNGYSVDALSLPDNTAHGWAVETGVRALPVSKIELFATLRYTQNRADPGHLSGETGAFYHLGHDWALGFSVAASPVENDYLLNLRWYY